MMIPTVTDELIAAQVDERSRARGMAYAADRAIVDGQRDGWTLRASCHGSRPEPYRVEVTFDDLGIAGARCSCPVGAEGGCKHVAALLITYRDDPDGFATVTDLGEVLETRSQRELIELIKRFVRQQPALIDLVLHPPKAEFRPEVHVVAEPGGAAAAPTSVGADDNGAAPEPAEVPRDDGGDGSDDNPVERLADAARNFVAKPGFALYQQVRDSACALRCWDLLRPILDRAVSGERHRHLRIRMYLHEGDVAGALNALPAEIPFLQWGVVDQVARAAEGTHPRAAQALYRQYVEALIQHRGRDNYRRACSYLERIRDLHGDDGEWNRYIAELRARHGHLPALIDELDTARL